jgi:hypothetical protein
MMSSMSLRKRYSRDSVQRCVTGPQTTLRASGLARWRWGTVRAAKLGPGVLR